MGSGSDKVKKKQQVAKALRENIPPDKLVELSADCSNRLVRATVVFSLWKKGFPRTDYTRFVKDLDSMLEVLFDALKGRPPGIGIIESDSYICDIQACKKPVDTEDEEGFTLILDEHKDEKMLQTLQEHQSRSQKRIARRLAASVTSSQPISKLLREVDGDAN